MRPNRPGEIDYYEELGVEKDASPEAIRDAFRALARLLHPDHQQDEHLKSTAERQLRRINKIYSVLSDPERRRRYNEMQDEDFRQPAIVFNPAASFTSKQLMSRIFWVSAAVVGVAIVIWVITDQPSAPVYTLERAPATNRAATTAGLSAGTKAAEETDVDDLPPAQTIPTVDEVTSLRAQLRAARLERDEARRELFRLKGPHEADERPAPPAVVKVQQAPAPEPVARPNLADLAPPGMVPAQPRSAFSGMGPALHNIKPPGSDPHQFAGFWYFAKASGQKPNNLYPPEFIELTLAEAAGIVHGRYRSRYQIVDRAISPDVNFEFTGSPKGTTINCAWSGPGGAHGVLTLRMTGDNDMRVDWTANEIGSIQALASGTAVLTRRLE